MPAIPCPCGNQIQVELWHAGSRQECPRCHAELIVPPLDVLKRLAGDRHPDLNDWQKLVVAIQDGEEPFDGKCLGCGSAECRFLVPLEIAVLDERHVNDDSPIGITPLGIVGKVSGGSETWKRVLAPLTFCPDCYSQFRAAYWKGTVLQGALIFIAASLAFVAFYVALPCGVIGAGVTLWVLYRAMSRWKQDFRFQTWVDRLAPVKKVLQKESEYRLRKLRTQEIP
jgi:hypothetical protein